MLLEYQGLHLWMTAGHVVRQINEICAAFPPERVTAVWYNHGQPRDAAGIPVDLPSLKRCELDSLGLDVGFVFLESYYLQLILANRECVLLNPQVWKGHDSDLAEGFVLLGYPSESARTVSVTPQGQGFGVSIDSPLTCMALRKIDRPIAENRADFWREEDAFYGQLADAPVGEAYQASIRGMSGGPIFSVRRDCGGIRYHLIGIQSAWLPERRILRACPISRVEAVMQAGCDWAAERLREHGEDSGDGATASPGQSE